MDPFQSAFVIVTPNMLPTSTSLCFNYVDAKDSLNSNYNWNCSAFNRK